MIRSNQRQIRRFGHRVLAQTERQFALAELNLVEVAGARVLFDQIGQSLQCSFQLASLLLGSGQLVHDLIAVGRIGMRSQLLLITRNHQPIASRSILRCSLACIRIDLQSARSSSMSAMRRRASARNAASGAPIQQWR